MSTILKIWRHKDGRTIRIYSGHKVRSGGSYTGEWPVLFRADVPNLTDEQWQACPVEDGWKEVTE